MYTRNTGAWQAVMRGKEIRSLAFAPTMALAVAIVLPLAVTPLAAQRTPSPSRSCDSCGADDDLADMQRRLEQARTRYQSLATKVLQRRMEMAQLQREALRQQRDLAMSRVRSMHQMPEGWLGLTFSGSYSVSQHDDNKAVMRFSDYPTVEAVDPGSPAERAGIRAGDHLLALGGHDVTEGTDSFSELLRPGARLAVKVKRGDATKNLTVVVGKRPGSDWGAGGGAWELAIVPPTPSVPSVAIAPARPALPVGEAWSVRAMPALPALAPVEGWTVEMSGAPMMVRMFESGVIAGAQVQRVDELRDYFSVDDGLLVLHVIPGTPAARSGLRAGDVIRRAGGRSITTPSSFRRALGASESQEMKLDVVRKGKDRTVVLKWDR